MISQNILSDKMEFVKKMRSAGLIESREGEHLESLISMKMMKLAFHPPQIKLPDAQDLLHSHPLFNHMSQPVFTAKVRQSKCFSVLCVKSSYEDPGSMRYLH